MDLPTLRTTTMTEEFKFEGTFKEKLYKKLFPILYRFYEPKIRGKRIRVGQPFQIFHLNGTLSKEQYKYAQGRTNSLFCIGLFVKGEHSNGWTRCFNEDIMILSGKHRDLRYTR